VELAAQAGTGGQLRVVIEATAAFAEWRIAAHDCAAEVLHRLCEGAIDRLSGLRL
jgi:hypothetical protein